MSRSSSEVSSESNIPKRIKFTEVPHSTTPRTQFFDRSRQASQVLQYTLGLITEVQELDHFYNVDSMPQIPASARQPERWETVEVDSSNDSWARGEEDLMITDDDVAEGDNNDSEYEIVEEPDGTTTEGQSPPPWEQDSKDMPEMSMSWWDAELSGTLQGSPLIPTDSHQPALSSAVHDEVTAEKEHLTRPDTESVPIEHTTPKTPVAQIVDKVRSTTQPQTVYQDQRTERTLSTVTEAITPSTNEQIMPLRRAPAVDETDSAFKDITASFGRLKVTMDGNTSQARSSTSDTSKQKTLAGQSSTTRAADKPPRHVDAVDDVQLLSPRPANQSQPAMLLDFPPFRSTGGAIDAVAISERSTLPRSVPPCLSRIDNPDFRYNRKIRALLYDCESLPASDPESSTANTVTDAINYWLLNPTTLTDVIKARFLGLGIYTWRQKRIEYTVKATLPPGEIRFMQMRIPSSARGEVMKECLDWVVIEVCMFLDGQFATFSVVFPRRDIIHIRDSGSTITLRVGKHGFLPRIGVHNFDPRYLCEFQKAYAREDAIIMMEQMRD